MDLWQVGVKLAPEYKLVPCSRLLGKVLAKLGSQQPTPLEDRCKCQVLKKCGKCGQRGDGGSVPTHESAEGSQNHNCKSTTLSGDTPHIKR